MESHAAFEKNLARMRRRQSRVAQVIEQSSPEETEVVQGPRGQLTVSSRGTLLASAYDPQAEGERMVDQMMPDSTDILIAIGFGLGHHLEAFRHRNGCPIIIYEPSPPRLRGALATRPIPLLENSDVFVVTELGQLGGVLSRCYTPGLSIRVFPHPSTLRLDPESVQNAVQHVTRTKGALDIVSTTRVQMASAWARLTVENLPHLVETPSAMGLAGAFRGMPAVVCAAGPSLDKQLPVLKKYADRVVVIAIGQVLGALRQAGIEPHIVHLVESQDVVHQLAHAGDTSNVNLFLLPNCHRGLFELPVRSRFTAYIAANQIGQWIASTMGEKLWMNSGGTVAQTAVFLADMLGADPVTIIGQDLAYTDGKAYAQGTVYGGVGFEDKGEGRYELTRMGGKMRHFGRQVREEGRSRRRDLVWVPGWHGQTVPTSPAYAAFRESYRDISSYLKRMGKTFINCTEGGALIPGIEHAALDETLERHARTPMEINRVIHEAFDAWEPPTRAVFDQRLERTHKSLTALEKDAQAGLTRAEAAPADLRRATSSQRTIDVLRGIGRYEKKVRQRLKSVTWLDALVQAGIHESAAASRRASATNPTPEIAVEESRMLFETTVSGAEQARHMLELVEVKLDDAFPDEADLPEPG